MGCVTVRIVARAVFFWGGVLVIYSVVSCSPGVPGASVWRTSITMSPPDATPMCRVSRLLVVIFGGKAMRTKARSPGRNGPQRHPSFAGMSGVPLGKCAVFIAEESFVSRVELSNVAKHPFASRFRYEELFDYLRFLWCCVRSACFVLVCGVVR